MAAAYTVERRNPIARALGSVVEVGRDLLVRRGMLNGSDVSGEALLAMCKTLIEHRGEASGLALAEEIAKRLRHLDGESQLLFFESLANDFAVQHEQVIEAAKQYSDDPSFENLNHIAKTIEAPRQKLFRRINMAPGGTQTLVAMRGHLLRALKDAPHLKPVDADLKHLFISWFNKGFLNLERIDWNAPAFVLERIISYEAVHEINGWDDLRNRLRDDRRCYAFFHPAMPDDPLVFVEVALTDGVAQSVAPLLEQDRDSLPAASQNSAIFYSISNCHSGLAGISFGNFLIKQVVQELRQECPAIKTFVTLSPVPGFRTWLQEPEQSELLDAELTETLRSIDSVGAISVLTRDKLLKLCARYLVKEKYGALARDPVARFHLGNGASLHRLNWGADLSRKGMEQSMGIMVNYLYNLDKIEINHEAYFDKGVIAASKTVQKLV
ncbi:MAG: malonyl-CoA decarboxylase [Congregibacter sp.]